MNATWKGHTIGKGVINPRSPTHMNLPFLRNNAARALKEELKTKSEIERQASAFLDQLKMRNYDAPLDEELASTALGAALESIRIDLATALKAEEERNWLNVGLATFADVLRNKDDLQLQDLAHLILSNVVKYMGLNQGALFLLSDEQADPHLSLLSCYAYDRKKYLNRRIEVGEGQVGQCVFEKDVIYMKQVPPNYASITSGLGAATPREILVCPLVINEQVLGVIEVASFDEIAQYKIEFLKKLSENIAAGIRNAWENNRVVTLLNASQAQTEALRAQEEELRQNMEELQATQEEMERKTTEISRASAEMSSIVKGINATMATIEFTPQGNIITANDNFLKAVKFSLTDIRGRHHRIFVPDDVLESEEYASFWQKLSKGQPLSGVFKRKASDGKIVWLNAIYNPIFDHNNEVVKVVKFATDITSYQEIIAESKGVMEGVNATMAVVSFSPNGILLDANENFLKTMGYKLAEVKGKHHELFVPAKFRSSVEYKIFWQNLKSGESLEGVFERCNADGVAVFLHAIYHPIKNADGQVSKVIKFATVVTGQTAEHKMQKL